ncbi:hypothetical protein [Saccharopolyspora dendranthemae]|uniref:Uncharacterized protein n=1 Tax=Saccharopolyspora dendranthemae TaxID=1181886 RepID=A0A561U4V7_9PSEU|nr:hypothetical protein [Saccharopolyspora dendranthemae]TWF94392.1 hypothetical protein FHU35_1396 [Saccharopolyspora dendranthemae]
MTYAPGPYAAPVPPPQPVDKQVNHLLHLVLTLLTCGAWVIVWALLALIVGAENSQKQRHFQEAMQRYSFELAAYQEDQARRWGQQNQQPPGGPVAQ